jgi:hypothetical protein
MNRLIGLLIAGLLLTACKASFVASERQAQLDDVTSGPDDNAAASVGFSTYQLDYDTEIAQAAAIGDPVRERLLIRRGHLSLQTSNPDEVGKRAVEAVQLSKGWVQRHQDRSYVFRIPAPRFDEVYAAIEKMGVVVSRGMEAEDVTGEVRDLELRLRNARALRDRYAELLKRAEEVKDLLAIEKQLAEVTQEIERIEGQLKRRQHDVAFSVLEVQLLAAERAPDRASRSPFGWLTRIGIERVPQYRPDRAWSSRVDWEVPEGYADMGRTDDKSVRGWLYSPEGVRIVVRRFDNKPRVDAAFWTKELRRELVRVRGYQDGGAQDSGTLLFKSGGADDPTVYGVRLIVDKGDLTLVEVVGPMVVVAEQMDTIESVIAQVEAD